MASGETCDKNAGNDWQSGAFVNPAATCGAVAERALTRSLLTEQETKSTIHISERLTGRNLSHGESDRGWLSRMQGGTNQTKHRRMPNYNVPPDPKPVFGLPPKSPPPVLLGVAPKPAFAC